MSDLPPVTFGIKVTTQTPAHVTFGLFAGRNPDARGLAGSLTLRVDEFEELVWRLDVDDVLGLAVDTFDPAKIDGAVRDGV